MNWIPLASETWEDDAGQKWEIGSATIKDVPIFLMMLKRRLIDAMWEPASEQADFLGGGLHLGGDLAAAAGLMKELQKEGDHEAQRMVVKIAAGGLWLKERLHQAKLASEGTCPRCGREPETMFHAMWECPGNNMMEK